MLKTESVPAAKRVRIVETVLSSLPLPEMSVFSGDGVERTFVESIPINCNKYRSLGEAPRKAGTRR